jgi:hypothetical protein
LKANNKGLLKEMEDIRTAMADTESFIAHGVCQFSLFKSPSLIIVTQGYQGSGPYPPPKSPEPCTSQTCIRSWPNTFMHSTECFCAVA